MDVRGVLFDWRGTLAVSTTDEEWAAAALRRLGRPTDAEAVGKLAPRLARVAEELDGPGVDSDADLHRRTYHRVLAGLGLDPALVVALYEVESDPACNVFAEDAAHTVTALRDAGLRIGVVSDIHVDIRPAFAAAGIPVDVFTLSFEQGVQKPAPEMFVRTLTELGLAPHEALMVGDRSRPDGAAVELGIPTLLLPRSRTPRTVGCTSSRLSASRNPALSHMRDNVPW
jgi:FMN phosphatase YigB (HAD superfamily)